MAGGFRGPAGARGLSARITIAAVGRAKADPAGQIVAEYLKRLKWRTTVVEIAPATPAREGAAILKAVGGATLVALDPRGHALGSEGFAAALGAWLARDLAFAIGGADGLDDSVRARAHALVSFGPMTWPHLLARAMLAEQLWRAQAILAGHPYHRG